jgi:hypothetical protein
MANIRKTLLPPADPGDLWWAARQKTAQYKGTLPERFITWVTRSFPGRATKRVPMSIITEGRGLGVDLNKYRTGVDVKMLADLGVRIFDLRLFGPTVWLFNQWGYQQDATFEGYYKILSDIPDVLIGAYGIYNPWLDEDNSYNSPLDPNVEYMKLYAKNYTKIHYHIWDVEVSTCTKGSNTKNGITSVNLAKGLSKTMQQTLKEMPIFTENKYPRIPEMYSAQWYLRQYGDPIKVWLENTLKDPANMPFLQWLAWLPQTFSDTYQKPTDLFDQLITPNGVQENNYLHMGNEPLASKWQCAFTLKGPWSPNAGIDCSITYGPGAQLTQYRYLHNIPEVVTPPPPPPPPPPPDPDTDPDPGTVAIDWEKIRVASHAGIDAFINSVK